MQEDDNCGQSCPNNNNHCGCNDKQCEGPYINMGEEKVAVDLNPEAPNMKRLLELVSKAAAEAASSEAAKQVVASLKFYGVIPYNTPEERAINDPKTAIADFPPLPGSGEGGLQVDLSGPVPKVYLPGFIGWKESPKKKKDAIERAITPMNEVAKEGPCLKEILDKLDPKDVDSIEIVRIGEDGNIPLEETEKLGKALATRLGKDAFSIVILDQDENGKTSFVKELQYTKSKDDSKDKPQPTQSTAHPAFSRRYPKGKALKVSKKKPHRGNLNFREIDPVENRRVYIFPNNQRIIVENAIKLAITDSGVHRLETANGEKYIIPTGWLGIKINSNAWPF